MKVCHHRVDPVGSRLCLQPHGHRAANHVVLPNLPPTTNPIVKRFSTRSQERKGKSPGTLRSPGII